MTEENSICTDLEQACAAIEAILFTLGESVSPEDIAGVIGHDKETTVKILHYMMDQYQIQKRGIRIIELEGMFQMCTDPAMYEYIVMLTHKPRRPVMTEVLLETLAIIAYKQPVTRAEVERIRGVSSSHAINKLIEYDLIEEAGRLDAPGRPILFATTEEFLRCYGLSSVDLLPPVSPEQMDRFKTEAEEEAGIQIEA